MRLPNQLIFFVTARCNYRCPGCFYWQNLNLVPEELSLDEIRKISSSLGNLSRLLISGGEPFLRIDLADICAIFYTQNHIKGIDLPTNASLPETIIQQTELILKKCSKAKLAIGISLDGLQETHDTLRQKPGSFKTALQTLGSLCKLKTVYPNLYIHIISVVSNKNINEIAPLIKFLKQNFDIDSFGPNPLRGGPEDKTLSPPTPGEWLELFEELAPYYRYYIFKKHKSLFKGYFNYVHRKYLDKITAQVLAGKSLPFICRAGQAIAVLEPNGDVRLCELTKTIGNLRTSNYDFKQLLHSPRTQAMRKQIKKCACTHGCFLSPSITLSPLHILYSLITPLII